MTWAPLVWIAAIAGAVYGLNLIWKHAACPAWRTMMAINHFAEALPILLRIAEEFKPNGGTSLRDQIDMLAAGQRNIEQQLENICVGQPCGREHL